MALEMRVYEELTDVDPKILKGLTARQLGAVSMMAVMLAVVAPLMWWFGLSRWISWVVLLLAAPLVAWAWVKPFGLRFEVAARHVRRSLRIPKVRRYENFDAWTTLRNKGLENVKASRKERKARKAKAKTRQRAQDALWLDGITESGVCMAGDGKYSVTLKLADINYQMSTADQQRELLERYARFFNLFGMGERLQITIVNRRVERDELLSKVLFEEPRHGDAMSALRADHNRLVREEVGEARFSIVAEKFLTVTVDAADVDEAIGKLDPLAKTVIGHMWSLLECQARQLTGAERIELLRELTRRCYTRGFDYAGIAASVAGVKDELAPMSVENLKHDKLVLGGDGGEVWTQTLVMRDYPSWMSDQLFRRLSEVHADLTISFHVAPIDRAESREMVRQRKAMLDMERTEKRRRLAKEGLDPELDLPHDLQRSMREIQDLLDDLDDNDQRLYTTTMVVMVQADSEEELDDRVARVRQAAKTESCDLARLRFFQEQGFNTALPLGVSHVPVQRTLTSAAVAVMVPFTSQEILDDGGLYYGRNAATGNPIIADRRRTRNGNAFVLGTSGSGKSFFSKWEIAEVLMGRPEDEVIIIDPEREYKALCEAFGGTAVEVHAASEQVINPMDIVVTAHEGDPVRLKAESVLSMIRVLLGGALSPLEESILDRSITTEYRRYLEDPEARLMPTFKTLYEELRRQPEEAAHALATGLEMYALGSFSGFAQQTNVATGNRFMYYDISKLGDHMKTFGMLAVMDQVWNRVQANFGKGIRTWLYMDEFHLLFTNPHAMQMFLSIYKRARKYGLFPTGITQNVEELLAEPEARLMLSNCDVLFLLGQKKNDADELASLLGLSDEQIRSFTNVEAGYGLLTFGATTLPFNSRKKQDAGGELLQLLSTTFGER